MYKKHIKRVIDFVSASILLILISPFFVTLMILSVIFIGRPIFFKQERTGLNGNKFSIIKFRTMTDKTDENGDLLSDEQRLVKYGKFLRSTSLDELGELINIIKGDMSVVGPRPLPSYYDEFYTSEERVRFEVRGGLIPPGGSLEHNAIVTWDKQFEYEKWYAENVSFLLDIKILFSAIKIIFQRGKTNYGSYVREPLNVERTYAVKKG